MPENTVELLIGMMKEMKLDIAEIKTKQEEAAISISVVETMQKAIEKLKIDERLRNVELLLSQNKGGVSLLVWLIPTTLSVIGTLIALFALLKH